MLSFSLDHGYLSSCGFRKEDILNNIGAVTLVVRWGRLGYRFLDAASRVLLGIEWWTLKMELDRIYQRSKHKNSCEIWHKQIFMINFLFDTYKNITMRIRTWNSYIMWNNVLNCHIATRITIKIWCSLINILLSSVLNTQRYNKQNHAKHHETKQSIIDVRKMICNRIKRIAVFIIVDHTYYYAQYSFYALTKRW